jgi:hypothetical protein
MYKLQQQFKEEVLSEIGNEHITQAQFQQRIAAKMHAHMMKAMPQVPQTLTTQQRVMHLQMLGNLKKEFSSESDLMEQIGQLQQAIISNKLTPLEVAARM